MKNIIDILSTESEEFQLTKEGIQKLGGLLTKIKSKLLIKDKNSEEHSLKFFAAGLTTTPMPIFKKDSVKSLEIMLNLEHKVLQISFDEQIFEIEYDNREYDSVLNDLRKLFVDLSLLELLGEALVSEKYKFLIYERELISLWQTLKTLYFVFLKFKSSTLKETSSVNFWPHHFDIAMLLFSGKSISNKDSSNWSFSREQMNFGFLFGDDSIPKPYFYVTIYPFNNLMTQKKLIDGAYWFNYKWKGAILEMQKDHLDKSNSYRILDFFNHVWNLAPNQFYNF